MPKKDEDKKKKKKKKETPPGMKDPGEPGGNKYSQDTKIVRTAEENQERISQREKRKRELMEAGQTDKQAAKQAREELSAGVEQEFEQKDKILDLSRELGLNQKQKEKIVTPEDIEVKTEESPGAEEKSTRQELLEDYKQKEKTEDLRLDEKVLGKYVNPNLAAFTEFLTGADFELEENGQLGLKEGSIKKIAQNAAIAGAASGVLGFAVKGAAGAGVSRVISSPNKAVKAANTAKNSGVIKNIVNNPLKWGVAAYAGAKSLEGFISWLSREDKLNDQQQALNTIGQMATTIGGQATEGAGDWRKGLNELRYIREEIERLGSLIQQGKTRRAYFRWNGKIYDIEADLEDQLRTIDEQITLVQSFALSGNIPELSDYELQQQLRDLEQEGYIESVDLTQARQNVSQGGKNG